MPLTRTHAAALLAVLASAALMLTIHAQTSPAPPAPAVPPSQIPQPATRPAPLQPARAVIFLDPAHGGPETGASLGNNVAEKDVTLAFAQRLRTALAAAGFAIVTTREGDLAAPLPPDQRAETANRVRPLACIVIHATAQGAGVHLYTSTLAPAPSPAADASASYTPIPWESAQAGFVDQSRTLSDLLKATLAKTGLPVLAGTAPLRPLDNLMCPAVAIEIAPRPASDSAPTPAADAGYQQQVASALASALQLWRTQNTPQAASPGDAQ